MTLLGELYRPALHESPHTFLSNYICDVPIGTEPRFLSSPNSRGVKILDAITGGRAVAGVSTFWLQCTSLCLPTVGSALTAPNAAVQWFANGGYKNTSRNDSSALVVQGAFTEGNPQGAFNRGAYVRTENYTFGNLPHCYPEVCNPGRLETDATITRNFHLTEKFYFSVTVRSKCGVQGKTATSVVGLAAGSAHEAEAYFVAGTSLWREGYVRRNGSGGMPQAKSCWV